MTTETIKTMKHPQPAEIIALREAASLTQTQAGELVHSALRTWQQWERGDRKMHPGLWELFQIKTATLIDVKTIY